MAMGKIPQIGQRVVIVGAGNVAVDAARSLLRLDKEVILVYRREKKDMPANAVEMSEAEEEQIKFRFLSAPYEIVADSSGLVRALCIEKMKPGDIDRSGRRNPVATGLFEEIPCDSVILAIGERVSSEELTDSMSLTGDGRIAVDRFTSRRLTPKSTLAATRSVALQPLLRRWEWKRRQLLPSTGC